jgi:hypothetical protein
MPEVVNCPKCERKLRIPEELLGKKVKCPTCSETFTATAAAGGAAPPPPEDEPPPRPRPPRDEDFQAEDRPSRRPRRDEDIDRDRDDEPRPRRRSAGSYAPHRGTLILVFGILGLVVCAIFAPVAWIMGNTDMKEIRAGRMDPEGESMTNIGRILGIIGTIWLVVVIFGSCACGLISALGGAGGGHRF